MSSRTLKTLAALLLFLSPGAMSHAQNDPQPNSHPSPASQSAAVTPEERLVRATYDKLVRYNRAAQLRRNGQDDAPVAPDSVLAFELRNFRVGPVEEILGGRARDLVTQHRGDVINILYGTHTLNDGPKVATYEARWTKGQYTSGEDPEWTIGDIFRLDANRFHDVGKYASYEVTLTFQNRSRTYRALVLFHNPAWARSGFKPEFMDLVVGMGGELNRVWAEKTPAFEHRLWAADPHSATGREDLSPMRTEPRAPDGSGSGSFASDDSDYWEPPVYEEEPPPGPEYSTTDGASSGTCGLSPTGGSTLQWNCFDYTEHTAGGQHLGTARFTPRCVATPNNTQRCEVTLDSVVAHESEPDDSLIFYHKGTNVQDSKTGTGPRSQAVSCAGGAGVAFNRCLVGFGCGVTASLGLSISGGSATATITGGDLWRAAHGLGHTCQVEPETSEVGTCGGGADWTLYPSTGCASGYVYNGSICTRSLGFVSQCNRFGTYDPETCSCSGGCDDGAGCSPILLDTAGNGFDLTDAMGGVSFDLGADGMAERRAWTARGSDDAWLVLDRNGNGLIDDGRELFGTAAPQPPPPDGLEKNGFLALAVFDEAARGGNGDGVIDASDAVYPRLRLWRDINHNGVSEPEELHALRSLRVESIALDYREARRRDRHGNEFRYRGKVNGRGAGESGKWAYDVYLTAAP
ncbi:MAG TPA: hypothetical protein VEY09_09715 [Pyrinomonadaceae bacterium]|nr:hypothetical protein [Pyrinomonadaceae bacterium]